MNLSPRAKVMIGVGVVAAVLLWVVLLDYGINAGRIHYGVHVHGVDVGGMTLEEARDVLQRRAKMLRAAPVVLSAEGIECSFTPTEDLGWQPRSRKTAQRARAVGFRGDLSTALKERAKAWFTGVEIEWVGGPDPGKVAALIDDCETQANALQLELDEDGLKQLVHRAIVTWPRSIFQVPVTPSA